MLDDDHTTLMSDAGASPAPALPPTEHLRLPPGWAAPSWAVHLRNMATACRARHPQRAAQFDLAADDIDNL